MKQILIIVVLVVGIVAGAVLLSGSEDRVAGQTSNNFFGQEEGIITVTEFVDFECPACAGFYPIVTQVKELFSDQVRFEIKHFPLVQIHQNAQAAHRASQAAANQGKFWEMHDLIFERQQSWNQSTSAPSIFEDYARELELDMDQYTSEVGTSEILAVINADIELGKTLGVTGTPTFFIDGVQIEDISTISTVESFSEVIQNAIEEKQGNNTEESETEAGTEEPAVRPEDEVTEE